MSEPTGGSRRQVAAGTVTLVGARLAVAVLAMVFIAISTRLLSLREMAVLAVYNSLCAIQAMVCSLGLLTTCTRELPALMGRGDADGASRLLKTTLSINAALSAVMAAILWMAAPRISVLFLKDEAFAPQIRWVAAGVFLWNLFEANQILLVALQRFRTYGKANVTCALAQRTVSLVLFALLAGSGRGLSGYIAGYAAGTLAGIAITTMGLRDLIARPAGLAPPAPLLRYALPFYADGYFRWLYTQADQFVIGVFLSPEVLSLYFVAKRFTQYYQQIVASSIDPVLAKVAEIRSRGAEGIARSLRSASRYFTLVFVPFAAGGAALSGFLLTLAGGAPYRPAALVLALLSISTAVYAAFNLVTGYVYVLGVPLDRLKHNMIAGVAQVSMMAVLLWGAQRLGAAPLAGAATIALARILSLLIGIAYADRQLRRYVTPSYDLGSLPRVVSASLLMAAAIVLPQRFFPHTMAVPLYALAGIALFVIVARPAVREEDFALLRDLLRGRAPIIERAARRLLGHPEPGGVSV